MDEQNKAAPASEAGGAKKSNHHRRHHRGHKHGNQKPANGQPREQQPNQGAQAPGNQKPAAPAQKSQQAQNNQRPGGDNRQKKNNHHNNNKNRNDNRRQGGDKKKNPNGGNPYSKRGPEDLYGHPTENDVLTMEELRAKIVLNAAKDKPKEPAKEEEIISPIPEELLIPMDENPVEAAPTEECVEVVGIRFRTSGKVYYFDPKKIKLVKGQFAIVETARGPEFGEVTFGNRMVKKSSTVSPLRPVLRAASDADIEKNRENIQKEKDALEICRKKIEAHKLDMKLIDAQYAFDNSKILFYFTSEGRVDFRELVKDLASVFRTRIELRQIGIRDEAKMLGGLGACGRPLCCSSFLSDFVQVSIKMAKEQGLSLNSSKISGVCGRLMCCLRYESEVYAEEIRKTPPVDSTVNTPDGVGTVIGISPLAGKVKVLFKNTPDTPPKHYHRDEVTILSREKNHAKGEEKKAADPNADQEEKA